MFDLTHSHTFLMAQNVFFVKVLKGSLHIYKETIYTFTIIARSSSMDSAGWSKSGCNLSKKMFSHRAALPDCDKDFFKHSHNDWCISMHCNMSASKCSLDIFLIGFPLSPHLVDHSI